MPRYLTYVFCIGLIALSCFNRNDFPQNNNVLAKVGDRVITVQDFIRRAEYTIRPDYCKQSNYIHKKIVLNSLIAEKLIALEMEKEKDELLASQSFHNYLRGRKEQSMRQLFYHDKFFNKTDIPDSLIKKVLPLSGRTIKVNYISLPDIKTAGEVKNLLLQNFSLSEIYDGIWSGEVPSKEINFFDKEPDVIHRQLFRDQIEKGQIIGPFANDDGSYLIMKVIEWKDEFTITEKEQKIRWNDTRDMVKEKMAKKEYLSYIEEIMAGHTIDFNPDVFDQYAYEASKVYLNDVEIKKQAISKALWEDIEKPKKIVINDKTNLSLDDIIFSYDNKEWTVNDLNQLIQSHPLVFRKRQISIGDFRNQLKLSIADLLRDKEITEKCYNLDLDKDWRVTTNVYMWHDAYASKRFITLANEKKGNPEKKRILYNSLIDSLQIKYSNKIRINTDEFEDIELTSKDMLVTHKGLAYPIVVPSFPILTSDDRLDYGSKLN